MFCGDLTSTLCILQKSLTFTTEIKFRTNPNKLWPPFWLLETSTTFKSQVWKFCFFSVMIQWQNIRQAYSCMDQNQKKSNIIITCYYIFRVTLKLSYICLPKNFLLTYFPGYWTINLHQVLFQSLSNSSWKMMVVSL